MVAVNCLHELFEAQARRTPQAAALAFEGRELSYAELERRANALAQRLQELGAGPEARVGLLVERSLELVVGILGILKAGAAYVPMDTAYPPERIAFMLSDAGAKLVLTQPSLAARLPASVQPVLVSEDEVVEGAACAALAHNLAYVIYTSGSTGRPKGVAVEHRNIVSYVLGIAERLALEPGMHYATVSTIAADLGHTVVFPALATGGCLHVVSQQRAENPALLAEYFRAHRIDVLKIVPSHLAALQGAGHPAQLMPARRLILGGEASRLDWIERLRAAAPQCQIFNHYGPTETTVGVLTYRVDGALPDTPSCTLPLGRALPGSRAYLLNPQGAPVAAGEKGELYIGGRGVARGYLNRPDLTDEKFVPDPFAVQSGARMYRTGDVARMLPDGSFEFCGRIDHQVKLNGYRVELGEIEAALREHDTVDEAVVVLRESAAGDKQVVGYVTTKALRPGPFSEQPTPAALREQLRRRLPQYMVPAAIVVMERLPLTANGKVDRQALAALALESPRAGRDFATPRTETEKTLVAIWGELLDMTQVGIHDDVFDLGAHSLMAMKALTRIRSAFALDLALRNLFEQPTIAGLAGLIDGVALAGTRARSEGEREEVVL